MVLNVSMDKDNGRAQFEELIAWFVREGAARAVVLDATGWRAEAVPSGVRDGIRVQQIDHSAFLAADSPVSPVSTSTQEFPFVRLGFSIGVVYCMRQRDDVERMLRARGFDLMVKATHARRPSLPEARAWMRKYRPHVDTRRMSISAVKSACRFSRSLGVASSIATTTLVVATRPLERGGVLYVREDNRTCSEALRPFMLGEAVREHVGPAAWGAMRLTRGMQDAAHAIDAFGGALTHITWEWR